MKIRGVLLGLDQPTAVVQRVRLDTGHQNDLPPMEVCDVARRMILIVAIWAGPVKPAQKPSLLIHRRERCLDRRAGLGRIDQIRPEDISVVVLRPDRIRAQPESVDRIRAEGLEVMREPTKSKASGNIVAFGKDPDGYMIELLQPA